MLSGFFTFQAFSKFMAGSAPAMRWYVQTTPGIYEDFPAFYQGTNIICERRKATAGKYSKHSIANKCNLLVNDNAQGSNGMSRCVYDINAG